MSFRTLAPLVLLLVLVSVAGSAFAEEVRPPVLRPGTMELLPLDDLQRADFQRENAVLVSRITGLTQRVTKLERTLQARMNDKKNKPKDKKKAGAEVRKLEDEIRGLRAQVAGLMVRVTEKLAPYGVDGPLVAYLNRAPTGPQRVERYAHGLVLLAPELTPAQRGLFERVVAQMEGSVYALEAQRERMALALKQTQLEPADQKALLNTFRRQTALSDQRFWQLVDATLETEQRAWIWRRLPTRIKRKSQGVEHLFALPDLTPSQATRLKALMTEMEHEASPDQALVKRAQAASRSRDKRLSGEERVALKKEQGEAYKRLTALRRYVADATREILTDEQWLEYEAIPPRVSVGDRRQNFRKQFEGFTPRPEQTAKIRALTREVAREQRETYRRAKALKIAGSDYGPDSPQTMMMDMQMNNMMAQGHRAQRETLGRILLDVLTPEQVSGWVMGRYGYKR